MKTDNYTPIELVNARPKSNLVFGVWHEDGRSYPIFGIGFSDGYSTHMVYGADYANPVEVLTHAEQHGGFWFDAGRDLYCTPQELERCMLQVGLIHLCPGCNGSGDWSEEFAHSGGDIGIRGGECPDCRGLGVTLGGPDAA